jgi:hypothetical protein
VQYARQYPFFFAWRPSEYDTDVALCWTTEDITPTNNGTRALVDVSVSMQGFDGT